MRVLLVEDDVRVAGALETALRRRGYDLLRAGSAAEALAAPPVDLVLLDLGLPDLDAHRVTADGAEISLTRKEYDLLAALARRPGAVVTRDQLLADVWQTTWVGSPHTVEVHVASLRGKLGDPAL